MNWWLILVFIFSRIWYLNPSNVFFDSAEYLERWSMESFWQAITSGHPPLHSGYILTFWPIFKLGSFLEYPAILVILAQILLSLITVCLGLKIFEKLFGKKEAIKTLFIFSISSFFWITNVTIMMESVYLFYWMLSVYFLINYLDNESNWPLSLWLSAGSWMMAFLTHSVVILWIPFALTLTWLRNKNHFKSALLVGGLALTVVSIINGYWLAESFNTNLKGGLFWLYGAKFGEHAQASGNIITSILRWIRNWIMPLGYNLTWTVLLSSFIGFLFLIKTKKWQELTILLVWILPTMITNQWWDSLFFGRHALIALMPIIYLATYYLKKTGWFLLSLLVLFGTINNLELLRDKTPYLSVASEIVDLEKGGMLIDSHFARPQTDSIYDGRTEFVDEPGWPGKKIVEEIDTYLDTGLPVYVTAQALSEPYGLFNGPYLHSLTLSYKNDLILRSLFADKYAFTKVIAINSDFNLDIFRLTKGQGIYPGINDLRDSQRRLDYWDPLFRWFRMIVRK